MRKPLVKLLLVALILSCATGTVAQESLSVVLKKAGTLKKNIDKELVPQLQKLKIIGEINSEDIHFLTNLPQIKVLDISDVTLQKKDAKAKANKGKYIVQEQTFGATVEMLQMPVIGTLEELVLRDTMYFTSETLLIKKLVIKRDLENDNMYFRVWGQNLWADTMQIEHRNRGERKYFYSYSTDAASSSNKIETPYPLILNFRATFQKSINVSNGKVDLVLLNWKDDLDVSVMEKVDFVSPVAFRNSQMTTLKFPDGMKVLTQKCFSNWKTLRHVDLNNVEIVGSGVFAGCENLVSVKAENVRCVSDSAFAGCKNLETLTLGALETIGSKALSGTKIKALPLPATIKTVYVDFFENSRIEEIEFLGKTAPAIYRYQYEEYIGKEVEPKGYACREFNDLPVAFWRMNYVIPQNCTLNFDKGLWREVKMKEKNSTSPVEYEIVVEQPGKLKDYLTDQMMENAEFLKVRGFLYDEEVCALDLCKHLRKLDLTHCYVTETPQKRRQKAAETAYLAGAIAFALGGIADIAKDGELNEKTEVFKEFYLTRGKVYDNVLKSSPDCVIPSVTSPNFKYLEELELPVQLDCIQDFGSYVKNVTLPRCATKIEGLSTQQSKIELPDSLKEVYSRAFRNCPNVEELVFPPTLTDCSPLAFHECHSLRRIDFSATQMTEFKCAYNDYLAALANLEEIRFPETLGAVANIHKLFGEKPVTVYFSSKSAPEGLYENTFRECDTVFIPKGCRVGWADFISTTKAMIVEF